MTEPRIVHRDAGLLVLDKPSGLSTTSPDGGDCLVARALALDPDAPRLHPSSRLDAEVTGLVTFARTPVATRALLAARADGAYRRVYLCLCAGAPSPAAGLWAWSIGIDPRDRRRRLALDPDAAGARPSSSGYRTLATLEHASLLALEPHTGRTHQLRVHAARAGVPILGDRVYGGAQRVVQGDGSVLSARRVMLHCARVELPGADGQRQVFQAPVHADMRRLWQALGGDPERLESEAAASDQASWGSSTGA